MEHLYIAARQARVGGNRDSQDNVILCYSSDMRLERIVKSPTPIRDVHQIIAADGLLYVASTYDDQIACYDIENDDWTFWQPFAPYLGAGLDAHHINSIFVTAGEIFMAGIRPKGWVARFDRLTRNLVSYQPLGNETHNVWLDGNVIHVCSSSDCTILRADYQSYALLPQAWTRGYCIHGDRGSWVRRKISRGATGLFPIVASWNWTDTTDTSEPYGCLASVCYMICELSVFQILRPIMGKFLP